MEGGAEERDEERSGLPRRGGSSPAEYLIPAAAVTPEFRRRMEATDYEAPAPRDASTVAVVRDGGRRPQVLLVQRPSRSRFAGGAWVFPGGVVDEGDRGAEVAAPDASVWAERVGFGEPDSAAGHLVAAVREVWEETGIFLAEAALSASELDRLRDDLLEGIAFSELAKASGFRVLPDRFVYLARWITPEREPRRYDTRFFLARAPSGVDFTLRGTELEEARWLAPEEAVRSFEDGDLHMLPPTVHTLRQLAGFSSVVEMVETLESQPAGDFLPRMSLHPDGILIHVEKPGRR